METCLLSTSGPRRPGWGVLCTASRSPPVFLLSCDAFRCAALHCAATTPPSLASGEDAAMAQWLTGRWTVAWHGMALFNSCFGRTMANGRADRRLGS
ncbi:uncharacterized protein K452DRAFT_771 [Aplosporella prunicola CBS 121167]|uniref:Uncharacterized protein n=1 Tax=Aplosporella prunicola CBS 121167 TaxID=1176127 RepID=A0A6A6BSG2_9PEZI|nr:uncharacterized protein K452DRAFT_771 [Aplosporella prunicola CBS 121167]KAF2147042.1 hypothetical protein K452DRAFT_771 [Aplosporella prunicola CBS 121167]